jgi:hypothetical protein
MSDERVSRLTDESIDFAIRMIDALPESERLIAMLRARSANYEAQSNAFKAENRRLRTALNIAAGMLSTYVVVGDSHPETMLNELLAEADKAIAKEADRG